MRDIIYNYPDYKVIILNVDYIVNNIFYRLNDGFYPVAPRNRISDIICLMPEQIDTNALHCYNDKYTLFPNKLFTENKDCLNNTKLVYIHSCCSIPRTQIASKYKITRNPWEADCCVIPDLEKYFSLIPVMIFLNEEKKTFCVLRFYDPVTYKNFKSNPNIKIGATIADIFPGAATSNQYNEESVKEDFCSSQLEFIGYCAYFTSSTIFLFDIVNNEIPKNKLVYENSIMATLGDENNKLTPESFNMIKDLLAGDAGSKEIGLKTLSNIDYNKFHNSVVYLLKSNLFIWDNKAINSTPVKFMLNSLGFTKRYKSGDYKEQIDPEDYAIIKPVIDDYIKGNLNKSADDVYTLYPFIKVTSKVEYTVNPDFINTENTEETA